MNIALIFAGGVGKRMNFPPTPKQFLELNGKSIIVFTLEVFDTHPEVDAIVVVCLSDWIAHLKTQIVRYDIKKVVTIVPGGQSGQMSIYNGLIEIDKRYSDDSLVLIHDGVRPLINKATITRNIAQAKQSSNAITTAPTLETFVVVDDKMEVQGIPSRPRSRFARGPQTFYLIDILTVHRRAQKDGIFEGVDSCSLAKRYGSRLNLIDGPPENIKITTPIDFLLFKAIMEFRDLQKLQHALLPTNNPQHGI